MSIDNLLLKILKRLRALFSARHEKIKKNHPFVGQYVVARSYSAGVHAGEVVTVDGENAILKDSRRLWSWIVNASNGVALSGVAQYGVKVGSKLDAENPLIYLTGVCELIICSDTAKDSIKNG